MNSTIDEFPEDPVLGDLRTPLAGARVLDAAREQLARVAPHARSGWREARVIEALYHPGRYLRVAYALLADPATPAEREWPVGQIIYLHTPVREPVSRRGQRLILDDAACEAYVFPNDRRLRELRRFAAKPACVAAWQRWLHQCGENVELDADTLQRLLMRYVPEQKCVVRLRAETRAPAGAERGKMRVAVRAGRRDSCREQARRHRTLAAFARAADGPLAIPDVIGADPDGNMLAIEWLRGDSLLAALATQPPAVVMLQVAEALRTFHAAVAACGLAACGVAGTVASAGARIRAAADDLASAYPDLRGDLQTIVAECEARQAVLLHNDFHWNQVRIRRGRVAFLDLERVGLGDPLIDVVNFVTQLGMLPQRADTPVAPHATAHWAELFLSAWAALGGTQPGARPLQVYGTLSRLELARGLMRHLRPGAARLARQCVQASLQTLGAEREVRI